MTAAAEHALRTLGEQLKHQGEINPAHTGLLYAIGIAHIRTADQLQTEREARDAKMRENPSNFTYDPKGQKHGTR